MVDVGWLVSLAHWCNCPTVYFPSGTVLKALMPAPKFLALAHLSVLIGCVWGAIAVENDAAIAQSASTGGASYYQDYQPVVVPTVPITPETAATGTSPLPPGALPTTQIAPPTSLNDPIWVMPTRPTAPAKVTVPDLQTIRNAPPSRSTPAAKPGTTPTDIPANLVVIATDVTITGADTELQQLIRNTIKTQPGSATSKIQLDADVAAILDTSLFVTATVTSRPNPNGLSVIFQVQPIVINAVRLSGAQVLTQPIAEQLFQPQLGSVVSPSGLTQAVQRINRWYAQNGYNLARVISLEPTRDGLVTINVAEGLVGDIKVRFVTKEGKPTDDKGKPVPHRTQEGFVRQQIKLQPGQIFREDVVREDLRRLGALGIFDTVNVTFEGDARRTTVVYNVAEGKSRGFNFGGGYNDDLGVFGSISYQDTNFSGLGQRLTGSVLAGIRDVQFDARFVSPYRDTDPDTPGYGANLYRRQGRSPVFDDEIPLSNGDDVRERRLGIGADLSYPLGKTWMGTAGLSYTNISIRDSEGDIFATDARGNPLTLSGTGIDDLTTLTFTATRDQRDNPTNPSQGSYLSFSSQQSLPIGRGDILGNRLEANYAQYIPVNFIKGLTGNQPQVLAFNIQGGTAFGDLPPYNAFMLGGINSVRGYDFADLALSRSYVLASAEYRFPIYKFIGGVVFLDVGSDLGTQSNVLGEPGVQRDLPGSGLGGGFGLRFNSPIGIIRTEFGINNEGGTQFHFGFGQRF